MSGWIVCDSRVVSSVNIADARHDKRVGLKAYPDASVPLVIDKCRWVHTFGMSFPIDVAYVDATGCIVAIRSMRPHRLGRPVRSAVCVVEAEPGAFRRWGLSEGITIEIRRANFSPGNGVQ